MTTYFVNTSASDANDGLTPKTAKQTMVGVASLKLQVGDVLVLKGSPLWGVVTGTVPDVDGKLQDQWTTQVGMIEYIGPPEGPRATRLILGDRAWRGNAIQGEHGIEITLAGRE